MFTFLDSWFLVLGYGIIVIFLNIERLLRRTASSKKLDRGSYDKGSTLLIGAGFGLGISLPLLLDILGIATFQIDLVEGLFWLVVMVLGLALRIWAAIVLGEYYTRTLLTMREQSVVERRPYSKIRHPGYLGNIFLWTGLGVVSSNIITAFVFPPMFVAVYLYRISVEEQMLVKEIGPDYVRYQRRTWKLIPHLY